MNRFGAIQYDEIEKVMWLYVPSKYISDSNEQQHVVQLPTYNLFAKCTTVSWRVRCGQVRQTQRWNLQRLNLMKVQGFFQLAIHSCWISDYHRARLWISSTQLRGRLSSFQLCENLNLCFLFIFICLLIKRLLVLQTKILKKIQPCLCNFLSLLKKNIRQTKSV